MAITTAFRKKHLDVPELHTGDRMTRAEFHKTYERMPENFKAELIGGIVHVASPLKIPHGTNHPYLSMVVTVYAGCTAGVEVGDNTTVLLGDDSEMQPDLFLRILADYGGRSKATKDQYVAGPPEWIGEVADSSLAVDLRRKKLDYQRHDVLEYLVVSIKQRRLRWFDLQADKELHPDHDGVYRMRTFPGLWIDAEALFAKDSRRLLRILDAGLATPEYAAFVKELADRHFGNKGGQQTRRK